MQPYNEIAMAVSTRLTRLLCCAHMTCMMIKAAYDVHGQFQACCLFRLSKLSPTEDLCQQLHNAVLENPSAFSITAVAALNPVSFDSERKPIHC